MMAPHALKDLQHIAIIMDGNGRWARDQNKKAIMGHRQGAKTLQKIVEETLRLKIPYLTVYAFSSENWARPKAEVEDLMGLMRHMLRNEAKKLYEQNIKLKVIGDRTLLPQDLQDLIQEVEEKSADKTALTMIMAISYGARQEILAATKALMQRSTDGQLSASELNEKTFEKYLSTAGIPDPDLLIRTSGEQRISNFLLWQCAYAELYFTPVYWPDFGVDEYKKAIDEYYQRKRRFGLRI